MKKNVHNYEIICLFPDQEERKKESLVKKIQDLAPQKLERKNLETEKLAFPIEVKNYLLLHLTTSPEKAQQAEKILQQSLTQYLLINLDKEKRLNIRKHDSSDTPREDISSNEESQIIE
ncbi:MAG: hypothetical protein MRECE_16c012 [Mycoplasmataceae bacterium CE_OT135]|nr:MAG: hypothetical protein MRECE_16c012 [Mycoplasmataceae bacterium CE_OT135]